MGVQQSLLRIKGLLSKNMEKSFKSYPKNPDWKQEKKSAKKAETGSMLKLFMEIFEERLPASQIVRLPYEIEDMSLDQYCKFINKYRVCFVSLRPIAKFNIWNYAHVVGRNVSPQLKFDKKNIVMLDADVHYIYDRGDKSKLMVYPAGMKLIELHDFLKEGR